MATDHVGTGRGEHDELGVELHVLYGAGVVSVQYRDLRARLRAPAVDLPVRRS